MAQANIDVIAREETCLPMFLGATVFGLFLAYDDRGCGVRQMGGGGVDLVLAFGLSVFCWWPSERMNVLAVKVLRSSEEAPALILFFAGMALLEIYIFPSGNGLPRQGPEISGQDTQRQVIYGHVHAPEEENTHSFVQIVRVVIWIHPDHVGILSR